MREPLRALQKVLRDIFREHLERDRVKSNQLLPEAPLQLTSRNFSSAAASTRRRKLQSCTRRLGQGFENRAGKFREWQTGCLSAGHAARPAQLCRKVSKLRCCLEKLCIILSIFERVRLPNLKLHLSDWNQLLYVLTSIYGQPT